MERKTKIEIAALSLGLVLVSGVSAAGIYAATTQNAAASANATINASANVSAKVEAFVNSVSKGSVEFAKTENTATKTLSIGDITTDFGSAVVKTASVSFKITNTSTQTGNTLAFTFALTDTSTNITTSATGDDSGDIAVSATTEKSYTFTVADVDLDAALGASWAITLEASK